MKVTLEQIKQKLRGVTYTVLPDGRTTICQITLANGYTVNGQSACVDISEFNKETGERHAYADAFEKIWALEGYLLAEGMSFRNAIANQPFSDERRSAVDQIAKVCHEVNRAYCAALGDDSQVPWEEAPEWQRESARMGVDLHLSGDFGPEASHISWMRNKASEGWVYGPEKDAAKKQHPCMVPFAELPRTQQAKDFIFRAVVHALSK